MKNNYMTFYKTILLGVLVVVIGIGFLYSNSHGFKLSLGVDYNKSDAFYGQTKLKISPTPPLTPTISVLSPNGGEIWPIGSDQRINIKADDSIPGTHVAVALDKISIISKKNTRYYLVLGPVSGGSVYWRVGRLYTTDCVQGPVIDIEPGQYSIHAILYQGTIPINPGECLSTRSVIATGDSQASFSIQKSK